MTSDILRKTDGYIPDERFWSIMPYKLPDPALSGPINCQNALYLYIRLCLTIASMCSVRYLSFSCPVVCKCEVRPATLHHCSEVLVFVFSYKLFCCIIAAAYNMHKNYQGSSSSVLIMPVIYTL